MIETGRTPARVGAAREEAASARYSLLLAERNPSLDQLLRERDPWPTLYTPLSTMLEQNIRGLVREWRSE